MGYMRHNAIIVNGPASAIDVVHKRVCNIAASHDGVCAVTPLTKTSINFYASFLVAPDGSKEGWEDSGKGDETRDEVIAYLESLRYEDGSTSFKFVEVQFGDDNKETLVLRNSDSVERGAAR